MVSNYEKEPIFLQERTWDDNPKLPEKYKFQGTNTRNKAEVHIDKGTLGMEFFLESTLLEFNQAGTRLDWSWSKSFSEFENVLGDGYCTTWLEVLTDHFPKPLENVPEATRELEHHSKKENFYCGISIFICKILGDQKPLDRQYMYMQPGGDYPFQKDLMTPPPMHLRQFKEMLRIAEALPASNWPKPLEALALEWFYMLFHKNNHNRFVTLGRKLDTKTFKLVTEFFEAQFMTNKNDGTLECMELLLSNELSSS
jgi:hypothetical protein